MKKNIILTILMLTFAFYGCKKDENFNAVTYSISDEKINTTISSASISGSYASSGTVEGINVVYGKTEDLESASSEPCIIDNQKFSVDITELSSGTKYFYCFEFVNKYGSAKTEAKTFETSSVTLPVVTTNSVSNITQTTATCGGNVTSDGSATVTARGVCWSTSSNPTTNNSHTTNGSGTGTFTSSITGLTANTTYYVRTYATNSKGTSYGEQKSFTTLQSGTVTVPSVTTNSVTNITQTTATCGGNVTSDGGATVTARGVCWSTSPNPTTSNSHTTNGSGTGSFTSSITTGLTANTTYYVRAYATNSKGTSYGEQKSFKTSQSGTVTTPTVTTNSVSNITQTTATCGGNVTSDGGATVTARGVCWSTSSNPTTSNSHTTDGSGTGTFTSSITGLTATTTYYVRAYATNSKGTSYGSQKTFQTSQSTTTPTVTTNSVSNITQTTATCGGNVTSDGGATVTARGVCWSTSSNPTTSNSHTTDGSGTGTFTSSITGLTANTTYYVRAYATNSKGTSYGSQKIFQTSQGTTTPTVTTNSVSNITQTTATCGGNVTSDGGTTVTARGVCWSTSQNPTTSNSHTTNGSGTGTFTSSITGLTENTTYYVRAYATNSKGTSYGTQKSFTTQSGGGGGTHEYVDLGLPSGLLWATCNVGAENPEDYGDYFAWGEAEPKSTYNWTTYQWCNGSSTTLTKYCTQSSYGYNGFVDNKTVLEMSDDAARANWGGDWRMPTKTEMEELENNCTWTWTTQNGKNGRRVTGPNGNSIFLPAAGYYGGTSLYNAGSHGSYWSSSLPSSDPNYAYFMSISSGGVYVFGLNRDCGRSVRPVCPTQK